MITDDTPESQEEHNAPATVPAERVILRVTKQQKVQLNALDEDQLVRLQIAWNALVSAITNGLA